MQKHDGQQFDLDYREHLLDTCQASIGSCLSRETLCGNSVLGWTLDMSHASG